MDSMMIIQKTVNTTTVVRAVSITINHTLRIQETIGGGHIGCLKALDLGVWMKNNIMIYHISFFLTQLDGNGAVDATCKCMPIA